jgi:hypothetical protein
MDTKQEFRQKTESLKKDLVISERGTCILQGSLQKLFRFFGKSLKIEMMPRQYILVVYTDLKHLYD